MGHSKDRVQRLKRRMMALPKAVREAASRATLEGAEELAKSMRNLAPVDTGDLRDSIVVTPGGQNTPPYSEPGGSREVPENSAVVTVGNTNVRYGHLVEYGTQASLGRGGERNRNFKSINVETRRYGAHAGTPAQPFFWPAVRSKKKKIANRVKRAISKAAREEWTK